MFLNLKLNHARRARRFGAIVFVAGVLAAGLACRSVPPGAPGPDADALAAKMLKAINYEAWQKNTAAVGWSFRGDHKHFWDRRRDLVEVQWDEYIARFNKNTLQGRVLQKGRLVQDAGESLELLAKANAYFVNDAFWLNPLFHIESPGVQLSLVGERSLKVDFSSGGVTPGDTYVFHTDENGLVTEMQLWVSIVPLKGSSATFENYAVSETGVKSARLYDYLVTIDIGDVKMYAKYPAAGGDDRFAELLAN
ncbi:MAG: hypothetical protein RIF32_22745 [Leptospirales bacterium]|jgi:hypothetical protein